MKMIERPEHASGPIENRLEIHEPSFLSKLRWPRMRQFRLLDGATCLSKEFVELGEAFALANER